MNACDTDSLGKLARAAFAVGLVADGVFFAQLQLLLLRIDRGIFVTDADWIRLAEFVFHRGEVNTLED
jgi:hypothetical protein